MSTHSAFDRSAAATPDPVNSAGGGRISQCTRARLLVVGGAAVSALVVWFFAVHLLGVELVVAMGSTEQPVGPVAVVGTALVAGLAGWGLLAVLQRWTTRARTVWTVVAVTVLLLSLLGPIGAITGSAMITLAILHLVVGVDLVMGLRASSPGRTR